VSNLVDDPDALAKLRQRGEREIYLYSEKRSRKQWAFSAMRQQRQKLIFLFMMLVLTGIFWLPFRILGLEAHGLPDPLTLAYGFALVVSCGIWWHFEFRLPAIRQASLAKEALRLAGSRVDDLHLYDGSISDFVPADAISTASGYIAIGIDPERQLMRHVNFLGSDKSISTDWIFGLDTLQEIDVVQEPVRGVDAKFLKFLGRPLPLRWVIHMADATGSTSSSAIDDKYVFRAKELVRLLKHHRKAAEASTA
jgi:hypothetical protein